MPTKLEELVPTYLKSVPTDPVNDQPMRYSQEDGLYRLWSVAMDRQDDGGQRAPDSDLKKLRDKDYRGDWVWHLPAPAK